MLATGPAAVMAAGLAAGLEIGRVPSKLPGYVLHDLPKMRLHVPLSSMTRKKSGNNVSKEVVNDAMQTGHSNQVIFSVLPASMQVSKAV